MSSPFERAWISALLTGALALHACSFIDDDFDKFEKRAKQASKLDGGGGGGGGSVDGGPKKDAGTSGASDAATPSDAAVLTDAAMGDAGVVDCSMSLDGTPCGMASNFICVNGSCQLSVCGDGYVDKARDEECEAPDELSKDGCEPVTCRYSCHADAECVDALVCNGTEKCSAKTRSCQSGMAASDGTSCALGPGSDGKCRGGLCALASCGNGMVDTGEECDPTAPGAPAGCLADCSWGCISNDECDDGNACNGQELCSDHQCADGTPKNCADDEPCTADSCVPGDAECHHDLIDADKDGFAPVACKDSANYAGGDCDDNDAAVNPGAHESCDNKDNDCNKMVDDNVDMFVCYPDADGDGYPLKTTSTVLACKCAAGMMPARADDQWDCYDENNPKAVVGTRGIDYNPGITDFFELATCTSRKACDLGVKNYDHNCDTKAEPEWTNVNVSSCGSLLLICTKGSGWTGAAAPNCGQPGEFVTCSSCALRGCTGCTTTKSQNTQACR